MDDSGSRRELQDRLAKHFKVTLPTVTAQGNRIIIVRSARESEYYTAPGVEEKYVRLRGDVVLEVHDEKAGTLQVIKAASVTYNQTRRSVSAEGGVEYSLTRGGKTDTFTGTSLAFDLDTSEAVFYDGSTTRTVTQGDTELSYTFQGETMTRMSNDTVILQNGTLTSSNTVDPFYSIRASQVWLLAPGEWAITNALLYIGRVPILYIPGSSGRATISSSIPISATGAAREPTSRRRHTCWDASRRRTIRSRSCSSPTRGYRLRSGAPRDIPPQGAHELGDAAEHELGEAHARCILPPGVPRGRRRRFLPCRHLPHQHRREPKHLRRYHDPGLYTPYLPDPPSGSGYTVGQQFWNSSSIFGAGVPFRYGLEGTYKTTGDVFSFERFLPVFL